MGPLTGVRVVEIASAAPAPFGCMVLGDLGADVIRVDRAAADANGAPVDPLLRNRRSVGIDLKARGAADLVLRLIDNADVLIEGFRPGVMERLGLGPDMCCPRNERLIYGRMTGWGQDGPLAPRAGHDINYIAVSGALHPLGRAGERPQPPLNLVGDFGGGGMLLAIGVVAALLERARTGLGQVIDAAMIDGSALLTASLHAMRAAGHWSDERGTNLLDGGAPFYDTYETADGLYMSVGALEGKFYRQLVNRLQLDADALPHRFDREPWPQLRRSFADAFRRRTREEWTEIFEDTDACVAPVLAPGEVAGHSHVQARGGFVEIKGMTQPAPAPRFSRSTVGLPRAARPQGADTAAVLREAGLDDLEIGVLVDDGIVSPAATTTPGRTSI